MKLVQGKIEQISVKEIANGPDRFDNTHRRSAKIEGVWYSFGGCKSNKWNVKVGNDFKVLGVGSEVAFKAEQSGDFWNGKSLMVLNLVEGSDAKPAQQSGGQGETKQPYQAKSKASQEGVSTGHALNGAMNFLLSQGVEASNENIVKYAKMVHNVTEKVKKITEEKNTGMDAYSVGAMSGNSILNACKFVSPEEDFEQTLEALAVDLLDNVVPKISAHVKGEDKAPAPAVKTTRSSPAKKVATKAKPVVEEQADSGGFEDMDDSDIPFADPLSRSGYHLAV